MQKYLKTYQEKLLHMTRGNRSVLLKKIYNKHNFDLTTLLDFKPDICSKLASKATEDKKSVTSLLLNSISSDDADACRGRLRQLSQNLKLIEAETGQQTGYLGFPFLQGHTDKDFFIRGPLVLFPISIEHKRDAKRGGWYIHILDTEPILNGALLATIKKRCELSFPDTDNLLQDMLDELQDKSQYTTDEFLAALIQKIGNVIPIDEHACNLELRRLSDLTNDDIKAMPQQKFHLIHHMIIGSFPQADNEIYKDYGQLLSMQSAEMGCITDLLGTGKQQDGERVDLDSTPDEDLNLVLPSDSSQDGVILSSKKNKMVVVRGPPGTGKSQVITNLVSDALSNSKKVLVVCQKKAALDVVHQRLGKVGLDKFAVVLDKEHQDRKKMYEQLSQLIEDPPTHDTGLKSIPEISKEIDTCVSKLSRYANALHKQHFGGITIQKLYSVAQSRYHPKLNPADLDTDYKQLERYLQEFRLMEGLFKKTDLNIHSWSDRRTFCDVKLSEKSAILQRIDIILRYLSDAVIAGSQKEQDELLACFDILLNSSGFLASIKKKKAQKKIKRILGIPEATTQYVQSNHDAARDGAKFWNDLRYLSGFFTADIQESIFELHGNHDRLKSRLDAMRQDLGMFDDLQEWDMKKKANPKMAQLVSKCRDMPAGEDWADMIRQEIYFHWIDHIESKDSILRGDPITEYEESKKRLSSLMDQKMEIVQRQIRADIIKSSRPAPGQRDTRDWMEFRKELKRRRKVKPIRQLFGMFGDSFLQVAPCWLASPDAVSKTFPLERDLFDLVIVDEASQLAVERTLPFLYRASGAVVAGDEKQLQPFDLFEIKEDEEDMIDEKSLLDLARVNHSPIQLAWHYRSKYQDLINYSNHAFYGGGLQVAPNVRTDPQHPPIKWINCNGVWQGRQNHQEATLVIDEMYRLWKGAQDHPTIGVITFNDEQRDLISRELEKRREDDPGFDSVYVLATENKGVDERPFVKNIENVQGDERDIIIISVGYGRDTDGVFRNFFGDLSRRYGENKLNVAVTRAKQHMVVVSSIEPSEIKETSKNLGPLRLRQFLEYAKGTSSLDYTAVNDVISKLGDTTVSDQRDEFDSEFEMQVHKRLTDLGYDVRTQIGVSGYFIDLAVVHPSHPTQYVLGIECDGAMYHSAPSVKERDVMRQRFLEAKGWKFERIWSRNWWKDPDYVISRVKARIDKEIELAS